MKIINKIKNYDPPKYIWILCFFISIFVCAIINFDEEMDIWFLLNHGRYVLNHGFPTVEPFTIHDGFSFVMQQWLSAVIFYLSYSFLGRLGLSVVVQTVNLLILYFLYKFCMLLSDNNYKISVIISVIVDLLLETGFILPRPQIFDFLLLIIVLYIMEHFYQKKNSRILLWLPFISILQINLHSSTWFMLFLFMLPYVVSITYEKIKDHNDRRIYLVLGSMVIMFLVGFINPYGIKNMMYVTTSYGNYYINQSICEMMAPKLDGTYYRMGYITFNVYGPLTYFLIFIVLSIYILYRNGRLNLRYLLLLAGVTVLSLINIKSLSLLIIGAFAPLALYLKDVITIDKKKVVCDTPNNIKKQYSIIISLLTIYIFIISFVVSKNGISVDVEKGVDYLIKNADRNTMILYTEPGVGSYVEYRGLKPYIDTRAEIFLKKNNKKEDIFKEDYLKANDLLDHNKFLNKYMFTHLIISKTDSLYLTVYQDKSYKIIYKGENYSIFEREDKQ